MYAHLDAVHTPARKRLGIDLLLVQRRAGKPFACRGAVVGVYAELESTCVHVVGEPLDAVWKAVGVWLQATVRVSAFVLPALRASVRKKCE